MNEFNVACVQLRTGNDVAENIETVTDFIREAAGRGADYIITPETSNLMEMNTARLFAGTAFEADDTSLRAFSDLAAELGIWLHIGSLAIKLSDTKVANRAYVFTPEGKTAAKYDKLHMFDVDLSGGESYRESKNYQPGNTAVMVDMPWGRVGLSICYDLRFPQLYRDMAQNGAGYLTVPAAFTRNTGKDHWHILLQARAIENGCFVFAPSQGGTHENGRETYGHSLIISPWGDILAEAGEDPGIIMAKIDPALISKARTRIPSLQHDRPYELVLKDASMETGTRKAS